MPARRGSKATFLYSTSRFWLLAMASKTSISKPTIFLVCSSTYSKGAQVASVATKTFNAAEVVGAAVVVVVGAAEVEVVGAAEVVVGAEEVVVEGAEVVGVVVPVLLHEVNTRLAATSPMTTSQSNFFMNNPP
jgi:hypothetical protein